MPRSREGSVYENKKRKCYIAQLDWTDDQGKRRQRKRQVASKTEGKTLIKKWLRELEEEGSAYLDAERLTFKEAAEEYKLVRLVEPVYRGGKKVAGQRGWEFARYRLVHIIEYFGSRRLRSITYADVEKYRNERLATPVERTGLPRSIADVNRSLALLSGLFTYCVQKEWLTRSPFSKGKPLIESSLENVRQRILSTDEQRAILQACKNNKRRHAYPIILTALDSGCRRGELLTLKWADVDLEKGTLHVRALNAKTNRERIIDLEPLTVEELRKLHKESGGNPDDLVFGIKNNIDMAWRSALKDAKVTGARFHDCRATSITFGLLRGRSVPFAMARSGHSDSAIFMRYVRMAEEIRQKQREMLREWDLAASLAELAENGNTVSELIN
jgi:integrase